MLYEHHGPSIKIYYRQERLDGFNTVIPHIGVSVTFYGLAVLRHFEMMRVYSLNESIPIGRFRDKLRNLQLLSRKGIGMPVNTFAHIPDYIRNVIELVKGAPLVLKLLEGTQGGNVVMAKTNKAAEGVTKAFRGIE